MKKLTKAQLSVLGQLSTKAYRHLVSVGCPIESYDSWRHEFTAEHCGGIPSWRSLNQIHYVPLCNALRAIIGHPQREDHTPKSEADGLIWTIRDRARHWGLSDRYIARIAADKFGIAGDALDTILPQLSPRDLRHLIYTIEQRGRKKAHVTSEQFGIDPPVETHHSRSTMPPPRLAAWRGDQLAR